MKLVREFRWSFLPAPGWTRSKLEERRCLRWEEEASKRGLLPSFWDNRYKVSKFGRDRAVDLHRAEVREDPQYGLRVHELSGKRLLCHCRATEKCHADNLRELFIDWHPHAFDPTSSARPPLSSELNILAKAREDLEDSEESRTGRCRGRCSATLARNRGNPWS